MSKVFLTSAESYDGEALKNLINEFFKTISNRLSSAETILLKPNLLQACLPEKAVTTHPDFVDAVASELKKYTSAKLLIGDSPGANFGKYEHVLEKTGMTSVVAKHGLEVVRIESTEHVAKDDYVYSSIANEMDLIINLPKLKTHQFTGLTLAVKNLFGLIPGNVKTAFHKNHPSDVKLAEAIYRYFTEIEKNTVHILDGILAHEGDGPSGGSPVVANMAAASESAVSLDYTMASLVGVKPEFCLTTRAALNAGFDPETIEKVELSSIEPIKLKLPLAKRTMQIPPFLKSLVAGMVYARPFIIQEKCIKCMLCYKSCPVDAIKVNNGNLRIINKDCIECFCCHEVCESEAIKMKRSLLHKVYVK